MLPRLTAAAIAIAAIVLTSPSASAQSAPIAPVGEQVGDLYRNCLDAEHVRESLRQGRAPGSEDSQIALSMAMGRCEGYIQGYIDGFSFGSYSGVDEYRFCIPESVTLAQIYAVFREYGRLHPDKHHWPRAWGLNGALYEAFPCQSR
jgi:hypothetical protein